MSDKNIEELSKRIEELTKENKALKNQLSKESELKEKENQLKLKEDELKKKETLLNKKEQDLIKMEESLKDAQKSEKNQTKNKEHILPFYKKLNNGMEIPLIGLGTSRINNIIDVIYNSIKDGIRLIDTAFKYGNEEEVGKGIKKALDDGLCKRDELFIIGKIWIADRNEPEKAILIKSTYKDNPFLEQSIIDSIESRKGDGNNNFWRVYGMGELGIAEGLVFSNFEQKDFDIEAFENYRNGVDWGFSQDPFAYVRCAIEGKDLYVCREIYQKGLLNKDSAPMVKKIVKDEIVRCDSAEPKSVAEFRQLGLNAISVRKGAGSVESGVKYLQAFEHIYIHPTCPNTYDEFCNYQWRLDKNGEEMPEPIDDFNHAIDALRYALEDDMSYRKAKAIDLVI